MFYDSKKKPYYVKYIPNAGMIDVVSLKSQGVKSDADIEKERKEREEKESSPIMYYVKKFGPWAIGAYLLGQVINSSFKSSN